MLGWFTGVMVILVNEIALIYISFQYFFYFSRKINLL